METINPFFSELYYRIAHLCCAIMFGIYKYGINKLIVFLISYFLVLEFISERIFSKRKRQSLFTEGNEIIKMIREEIEKRSNSN